ncbi:PaaI family thioesterase [Hyphomonas sp. FCG-A18]|uniref:PaaI family thioesterase n=1 Tax=Hyphomonas sp. FCG-A18 TaxID=3080019 RepID=UPI002B2A87D2|nr:PaaI family thioesterase [Hyphomonas sp. FCG-A18]
MPQDRMLPPDGFERHFRRSGLTDPWEPLYSRKQDDRLLMGLVLAEPHCNSRGLVHGGLIAALADNAMGLSCVFALAAAGRDAGKGLVTVSLGTDYLGAGKLGEWLQINPEPVKVGDSICFARALITSNDVPVAMANATFKIL